MFDKIINLNNCHLQKNPSNSIRLSVKQFADKNGLSYFDIRNHEGLLRNLMIRTTSSEDLMVLVQFYENDKENIQLLMEHLKTTFPEITSLLYIVNQKANNTIYDQEVICYNGKDHIIEEIDGLYFKIGQNPSSKLTQNKLKYSTKKQKNLQISTLKILFTIYTQELEL